jgi:hypothetical protein
LDDTNWRAELANCFGAILRKVWGGNQAWAGADDDPVAQLYHPLSSPVDTAPTPLHKAMACGYA